MVGFEMGSESALYLIDPALTGAVVGNPKSEI